jgi:C-terminal processing protease CtpA/Prc
LVTLGSEADKMGIRLGDRILEVNGEDTRVFTKDMWCKVLYDGLVPEEEEMLTLLIEREGENLKVQLHKKDLLKP